LLGFTENEIGAEVKSQPSKIRRDSGRKTVRENRAGELPKVSGDTLPFQTSKRRRHDARAVFGGLRSLRESQKA
jgi:hypothetical protein